jgi:hypothetical protein
MPVTASSPALCLRAALVITLCVLGPQNARSAALQCGPADRHFDPAESPVAPVGSGRIFYVDAAAGNDSANGMSEGSAFRTIGHALGVGLNPGDTVRIKAGLYRERPVLKRSGIASSRIVVGAYGNGPVLIDASTPVGGWTLTSGQIFRASVAGSVTAVVVGDVPLFPEFSQAALREGSWYYDAATKQLYLWCPGGGNPASRSVGVVADDAYSDGFTVQGASYVTLYGLTVRFAGGHGISILGDYVRVEKCRTRFNGKAGINVYRYGTTTSTNAALVKNEIYHNVLRNWPRGRMKWGGWAMGAVSNGTPNCLFQGNVVYRNGGEGLGAYGAPGGAVFRDNVVYDNWSVNIYPSLNSLSEGNFIFSHQPNTGDLYNNGDTNPADNVNLKRLRPDGVLVADEGTPVVLDNAVIRNNVIVNCRRGFNNYHGSSAVGSGLKHIQVVHNTIVVPSAPITGEATLAGLVIPYNEGNDVGSRFSNNIVYGGHPDSYLLYRADSPASGDSFAGLTMDHNVWYHSGRNDRLHWGLDWHPAYDYTLDEWKALSGTAHGAGDAFADPLLVDTAIDDASAARVLDGSPALGAGAALGVDLDYGGCPRSATAPTAGAFEAAASPTAATLSINDASVTEGDSGAKTAFLAVSLANGGQDTVTVRYATADGSATQAGDYLAASGTLTFLPGETTKTIAVAVLGDTQPEELEAFSVRLSDPVNAFVARGQGQVSVIDDDVPSTVTRQQPVWQDFFAVDTRETPYVGDFNGDGRTDIITFTRDNPAAVGDVYVALSNGAEFGPSLKWHDWFAISQDETVVIGDYNGDGKDDIATWLGKSSRQVYVALSQGSGMAQETVWLGSIGFDPADVLLAGDANGDGKTDLVLFARRQGKVYVALSDGKSFRTPTVWHSFFAVSTYERPRVADVNGDGRADIVTFATNSPTAYGDVYVAVSNGARFGDGANSTKWHDWFAIDPNEDICVGDVNGDRKDDFATFLPPARGGDYYTVVSLGSAMGPNVLGPEKVRLSSSDRVFVGDVNGDKKADVIVFAQSEGKVYVVLTR